MGKEQRISGRRREAGIALLISIFILLLISVVAIALIVSSGTESALTGNYRSSTAVYYAALAGVEEVRARLRASDPNAFRKLPPGNFLPAPGTDLPFCNPVYVLNPAQGEVVTPWDSTNPYYDTQYNQEFGATGVCTTGPWPPSPSLNTLSVWNPNPLPFPAPAYKWVRINSITEQTLQLDVAPYDGTPSEPKLIYYDGTRLTDTPIPGSQVLEITALAVLPSGSQKLLQYLVAPIPLNLTFPSALTLDGNNVQFSVPTSANFQVQGVDQGTVGNCNPSASVMAVGYTNAGDQSQADIRNAIPSGPSPTPDLRTNYTNVHPAPAPPITPNVGFVTLPTTLGCPNCNLTTVAGLNALVQAITEDADVVINGNADQSIMPSTMSATNPMTIVVNGSLTFNGWRNTGYGLLLVTGDFDYDPDASWDGIVLVIGTGKVFSNKGGTGQFLGAMFLANTTGGALGSPFFDFASSSGGTGVYYSSCWVQASQPTTNYKVLSFHEISQ